MANRGRLSDAVTIFARISSHYLPHNLRHLRFGTAAVADSGDRQVEDLLSLPDLMCGALVDLFSTMRNNQVFPDLSLDLSFPDSLPKKARLILQWLADGPPCNPLKHLVYTIEPGHRAGKVVFKDVRFTGIGLTR